jgi:hypothetical protein
MKTIIISTSVVIAAAALTAACSSASSPAKVTPARPSHTAPATTSSTEIFTGDVAGKAALVDPPAFVLRYAGPVDTAGSFTPGGSGPEPGQMHAFPTRNGTLELTVTSVPENGRLTYIGAKSACDIADTTIVNARIDGAKSTGRFAGATGTAQVDVGFSGKMPKLKDGTCNMSQNANPSVATARAWVTGTITLTLKK